jgi:Gtr1/RagA G protein conserved region.
MSSAYPSYAATSITPASTQYLPLNGHRNTSDFARTKILLLGLRRCVNSFSHWLCIHFVRRSGKTSIQQVLFNHLPPKQTFYLETTIRTLKHTFEYVFLHPSPPCVLLLPLLMGGIMNQYSHPSWDLGLSREYYCRYTWCSTVAIFYPHFRYWYPSEPFNSLHLCKI